MNQIHIRFANTAFAAIIAGLPALPLGEGLREGQG